MTNAPNYFSSSLEKGLKILSLFNKEAPDLSQTQVSKALELNMTSTFRYLNTFVELGYLRKNPITKRLSPDIRCLTLCSNLMKATDYMGLIKGAVDEIYNQHKITIDVVFAIDDGLMRVYHREAEETLTYNLPDVAKNCLHNTSVGKAFLSMLPEDEFQATLNRIILHPKTEKSIIDRNKLITEIKKTRQSGFSMSKEEFLPGLITIGAPLVNPNTARCVGGISFDFSIIQHSPERIEEKYAVLIMEVAKSLSKLLP